MELVRAMAAFERAGSRSAVRDDPFSACDTRTGDAIRQGRPGAREISRFDSSQGETPPQSVLSVSRLVFAWRPCCRKDT
jgi:hypothetical protein